MKINRKKKKDNKIRIIVGILVCLLAIVLVIKLLVPMAINIIFMFLALLKMYSLLSFEYKFLGGCFFIVVFWYIFSSLTSVSYLIFKFGKNLILEDGRNKNMQSNN